MLRPVAAVGQLLGMELAQDAGHVLRMPRLLCVIRVGSDYFSDGEMVVRLVSRRATGDGELARH